ncbi:MAG: hypothetical protein ACLFMT_06195, partial [Halobacteriales archaeon]
MNLEEYVRELEPSEERRKRELARKKSYEIVDHLEEVEDRFTEVVQGDSLYGQAAPSVFVGRTGYPRVNTGVLQPVASQVDPADHATSSDWYGRLDIDDVLGRRTSLLNSRRKAAVERPRSQGFLDVQREVAAASDPVDVEVELDGKPRVDASLDSIRTPTGPNARAVDADLAENPSIPRHVDRAISDGDWRAADAVGYLYDHGYDVYEIQRVFSTGGLGVEDDRRLVPTRWTITAVDDTVGKKLHREVQQLPELGETRVYYNEYMGNRFWVVLGPGRWEFELVEMKSPGSVWNPRPDDDYYVASANEGYGGRSRYVEETAGAYYASRLGVLEHLVDVGRQAKALVLRAVGDDYWAPVGVWHVREIVRNAFDGP